jgi:hypothetical protein
MKRYRSHKLVEAGVIVERQPGRVRVADPMGPGSPPFPGEGEWIDVPDGIFVRGDPVEGVDYLVRYIDGYISWSPKAAFEAGYDPHPA